jgi:hypothetical protein
MSAPSRILETNGRSWPACLFEETEKKSYDFYLQELLEAEWGEVEKLNCDDVVVGTAARSEIKRSIMVFTRDGAEPITE